MYHVRIYVYVFYSISKTLYQSIGVLDTIPNKISYHSRVSVSNVWVGLGARGRCIYRGVGVWMLEKMAN